MPSEEDKLRGIIRRFRVQPKEPELLVAKLVTLKAARAEKLIPSDGLTPHLAIKQIVKVFRALDDAKSYLNELDPENMVNVQKTSLQISYPNFYTVQFSRSRTGWLATALHHKMKTTTAKARHFLVAIQFGFK